MRLATLAFVVALGCQSRFTGPYPCLEGYASCVQPSQNLCETDTTTDGLHCGACGAACGVGAPCVAARCGQAATVLATLAVGSQTEVQANASAVFWTMSDSLLMLPASAGPGATPTTLATDMFSCGSGAKTFAVDDANVYFWSNGFGCTGTGPCGGLVQLALADGARTLLVPTPASGGTNFCGAFAVSPTTLYWLDDQQQGNVVSYFVYGVRIGVAGQTLSMLASGQSYNGQTINLLGSNASALFFEVTDASNAQVIQTVPLAGGASTALPIDFNTFGSGFPFVVDDERLYAVVASCPCNDNNNDGNNNGNSLPPAGRVVKVPLAGGPSTTLATFTGLVGGVDLDATNVYWSTDTTAWRVPRAGGAATPVAGNLAAGAASYVCNNTCGGSGQSADTAIAVGATSLYLAVTAPADDAVLEVAK